MQRMRVWLWIALPVVLVVVFLVSRNLTRDRLQIRTAKVVRAELINTVPTNGLVEPEHNIEFHSPLATTIRSIEVHQGDHVRAGQLLMQLDDVAARARVAAAESGLKSAQVSLDAVRQGGTLEERQSLKATLDREQMSLAQAQKATAALEKLQATGAASASEVEASSQRVQSLAAALKADQDRQSVRYSPEELERAQAAVNDAEASLAAAKSVLNQTSIHAPSDGTVYSIPVGHSDFVEEGRLLLQMADMRHMRVRAYFDEPEIGSLAIGQQIHIAWNAAPGKEWVGHIVSVPSTIISYGTRNVGEALVAIDGPDDELLPETHVTVTVTTSSAPNTLTLPRDALHSEGGKPFVFKVVGDSLKRTPIVIGKANLNQVPIISGLQEGDVVATRALNEMELEEGVPIKVVK